MGSITAAYEESTYILVVKFFGEEAAPVIPTSATWTLTYTDGDIVNSRENVNIAPLAAVINIALSGLDLALDTDHGRDRVLTVKSVYTSEVFGSLPINDYLVFEIQDLVAVG